MDFSDVLLYGITASIKEEAGFFDTIDALLSGGVDALQLRCRDVSDRELIRLGTLLKEKCENARALFLVDNRADIALACDADGVHLGHDDMPMAVARKILGHRKIIGASTHSLAQALEAQKAGADYVSCGPIWVTPTKPEYEAVGLNLIGLYKAALRIPFVVIGGLDETNIDEVIKAGAPCVAMVRALFDSTDPAATAEKFREKVKSSRDLSYV